MAQILNSLGRPIHPSGIILGKDKKPIILDRATQRKVDIVQRRLNEYNDWNQAQNALGMDQSITTMTTIVKKISTQKFYTSFAPLNEYAPVAVGQGPWSDVLITYRDFQIGDAFETGIVNMSQNNARVPNVDAGVDAVPNTVFTWNKGVTWTIPQMEMAARAGNWDRVGSLQRALKKNWDLGIQRIFFLGANQLNGNTGKCFGLLNMPGITIDTTVLTPVGKLISQYNPTQLAALVNTLVQTYQNNNNYTAFPTHFHVPQDDWNGMAAQASPNFPIGTTIKMLLEKAFKDVCPNFKAILPIVYSVPGRNGGLLANHRYVLLNHDEESLRMDIPVPFTSTVPNSLDNFHINSISYGQFTGFMPYRPKEILYLEGGF